ncbi:LysR substrate-binding domain-containing protein [Sphingopyxis sp. 113P3]|uniref:LysR substrate-binding domain-containing protein n=1 Tax=Sphingopyxis sp. (strain 113P3) TaxID=292913 RepID=UPI0011874B16|nr:LysR substrate-binding domain-containing protein [Sphingopyxis sp. 113P3]
MAMKADTKQRDPAGARANVVHYGLTPDQRRALPPFAALKAFEAIGTCGGIRRAAEALSIDHAAISRHLRALEEWAGTPLFDRASGSNGQLTEAGARFHKAIAQSLTDIASAAMEFIPQLDDKHFVLWCAPGLASEWLTGRIGEFSAAFPDIQIELQPIEILPEAVDNNVDAHIHYVVDATGYEEGPAFRSVELLRPPILAVASPAFLASVPPFKEPADLLGVPLLHEASFDQWRRWFEQHGVDSASKLEGPRFWQGHLTLAAARRGQGIALANALLVGDSLRDGELVEVGAFPPVYLGSYVLTSRRTRWRGQALVHFRRWIERALAS